MTLWINQDTSSSATCALTNTWQYNGNIKTRQNKPLPRKCQLQLAPFLFFAELFLLAKLHPEVSEADNNSAEKQPTT